jgi:hypothetical protein
MNVSQFTESQQSIIYSALETRLTRVEEMIAIFGKDEDSDSPWMVEQYQREKASIMAMLVAL